MLRRDFVALLAVPPLLFNPAVAKAGDPASHSSPQHANGWPIWASRAGEQFFFDARTQEGYRVAQHLLRDVRARRMGFPHPYLLRAIAQIQHWWALHDRHVRIDITSGMRTPQTNNSIEGAARASLHLPNQQGVFFAADFRPTGMPMDVAAHWLRHAGIGGVGLYLDRNFIHADVGRARSWVARR